MTLTAKTCLRVPALSSPKKLGGIPGGRHVALSGRGENGTHVGLFSLVSDFVRWRKDTKRFKEGLLAYCGEAVQGDYARICIRQQRRGTAIKLPIVLDDGRQPGSAGRSRAL